MKIELFEKDIALVDDILAQITSHQYAQYMYDALYSKYDRAQADRVCRILINEGIAKDSGHIFIGAGESAYFIVEKGGGRYLYAQQEEAKEYEKLQREDTRLSVWERKRNKIAFWVTMANSVLLLPTIFKLVKSAIAYFSHLF